MASETIWNQFWSFQLQKSSLFCKTSSVIEQLRDSNEEAIAAEEKTCATQVSSRQSKMKKKKGLTSLTLVGGAVSHIHYDVSGLADALEQNTSLQHVTICGTFLQSLRQYQHYTGIRVVGEETPTQRQELRRLFGAIGTRPNLESVELKGNEDSDSFPVECVTALFLKQPQEEEGGNRLKDFSCQYVDMAASGQEDLDRLGAALGSCRSLRRVTFTNLSLQFGSMVIPQQPPNLDGIISSLGHCEEVELGLRFRDANVSGHALRQLMLGSAPQEGGYNDNDSSEASNLKKLTLRRRLPIHEEPLIIILQSLCHTKSQLKELQIDDIHVSSHPHDATLGATSTMLIWKELAIMLQSNTNLESLELSFSPRNASTHTIDATMSLEAVQAVTCALSANTTLKRLVLRGIYYDDEETDTLRYDRRYQCWLELLEHGNYSLEELDIFPSEQSNVEKNGRNEEDDSSLRRVQEKLNFFLQLNRQRVTLPPAETEGATSNMALHVASNGSKTHSSRSSFGLRALLRMHNGALPHDLILPCIQAALDIQDLHLEAKQPHCHSMSENAFFQDFSFDGDSYDLARISDDYIETFAESETKQTHGTGGLFYLFTQHPSLITILQERLESPREDNVDEHERKQTPTNPASATKTCASVTEFGSAAGGSPELLLLDDDIVALW